MATIQFDWLMTATDFADLVDVANFSIHYWAHETMFSEPYLENDPESLYEVWSEGDKYELNKYKIEESMAKIFAGEIDINEQIRQHIVQAILQDDLGEIDSVAADCIIQVACFNEIIYG